MHILLANPRHMTLSFHCTVQQELLNCCTLYALQDFAVLFSCHGPNCCTLYVLKDQAAARICSVVLWLRIKLLHTVRVKRPGSVCSVVLWLRIKLLHTVRAKRPGSRTNLQCFFVATNQTVAHCTCWKTRECLQCYFVAMNQTVAHCVCWKTRECLQCCFVATNQTVAHCMCWRTRECLQCCFVATNKTVAHCMCWKTRECLHTALWVSALTSTMQVWFEKKQAPWCEWYTWRTEQHIIPSFGRTYSSECLQTLAPLLGSLYGPKAWWHPAPWAADPHSYTRRWPVRFWVQRPWVLDICIYTNGDDQNVRSGCWVDGIEWCWKYASTHVETTRAWECEGHNGDEFLRSTLVHTCMCLRMWGS